jgi:hypothetical protein
MDKVLKKVFKFNIRDPLIQELLISFTRYQNMEKTLKLINGQVSATRNELQQKLTAFLLTKGINIELSDEVVFIPQYKEIKVYKHDTRTTQ